jgi:high-affinity nickel permease
MIHHQAKTRPVIGSVDSLMTIIALTPIKTEMQEVIHAAGQIVNTNPSESILLSLICRSSVVIAMIYYLFMTWSLAQYKSSRARASLSASAIMRIIDSVFDARM